MTAVEATGADVLEGRSPGEEWRDERSAAAVVDDAVADARAAMEAVAGYDQAAADDLARAVALAVYREEHADRIARVTVAETGMGNVPDKRAKLRERMLSVLEDALDVPTVGELPTDRPGVVEFAKPVGVVGALVPSTNPGPTAASVALLAVKGRNAVVLSAAPASMGAARLTVDYIRLELDRIGAPADLVQLLPGPASKDLVRELLGRVDLAQVTGSWRNVEAGQTSGTPNYCVGEGNLVVIVDETADVEAAAARIADGVTFDHGVVCVAESNVIALESVYADLLDGFRAEGGYVCSTDERDRLESTLFPDGAGSLRRDLVGRPAGVLADEAGIAAPEGVEFLVVEGVGLGPDHPLSGELLSPVLATYEVADVEAAIETATRSLEYQGAGHSCTVHTALEERAERIGRALPVCRVAVNQSGMGTAGTARNGLTTTYSLGGGPWAGNQLDGNLSAKQFVTATRVAYPLDREEPAAAALFAPIRDGRSGAGGE